MYTEKSGIKSIIWDYFGIKVISVILSCWMQGPAEINIIYLMWFIFSVADKGFEVISNYERKWCKLFADFIAGSAYCDAKNCAAHSDDMLWYVSMQQISRDFCIGQEVSFISHVPL